MKVLVVEDDEFKRRNVQRVLVDHAISSVTKFARSITSALREIEASPDIEVVILDMSLPTYDVGPGESGGRPQGFGGLTVMQHLEALGQPASVIVLTQFLQFGDDEDSVDVEDLREMLAREHGRHFKSLIHYGAGSDQWKEDLILALRSETGEGA